jgi:hypothetical protein
MELKLFSEWGRSLIHIDLAIAGKQLREGNVSARNKIE